MKEQFESYRELVTPLNDTDEIDVERLNNIIAQFGSNYGWILVVYHTLKHESDVYKDQYDRWRSSKFAEAESLARASSGGKAVTIAGIEARLNYEFGAEDAGYKLTLIELTSKTEFMSNLVRALDKVASQIQTLSSNLRQGLATAAGLPISRGLHGDPAQALESAMNGG